MKKNADKCKTLSEDKRNLSVDEAAPGKVESFIFLGSLVEDMKRRIALAAAVFGNMVQKRRREKTEITIVLYAYISNCIICC